MQDIILGLINKLLPDILYLVVFVIILYGRRLFKEWIPKIEAWVKAHTTEKQRKIIKDLGHEAFAYAETVFREKTGPDKLQAALSYFNQHMSKCGLTNLSSESIRAAVEAAWMEDKRKEQAIEEIRVGGTQ